MAQRGTKRGNARVQLIDTALDLFDRHGFHAVGIDKILSAAGLAKMTLYHHFESKEALIVAALEKRDAGFRENFAAAIADAAEGRAIRRSGARCSTKLPRNMPRRTIR